MFYGEAVKHAFPDADMDRPLSSKALIHNINGAKYKTYDYFDNESRYIDPTSKYAEDAERRIDEIVHTQEARLIDVNRKTSTRHL